MVEKKVLKWSLLLAFIPIFIGLLLETIYLLSPPSPILGYLVGVVLLLIVFGGLFILISIILTVIDVFQSKTMGTGRKLIWAVALLFTFGFGVFVAALYYFLEKK